MCILLKFKGYLVVNVLRTNILHPTIPMVSVHGINSAIPGFVQVNRLRFYSVLASDHSYPYWLSQLGVRSFISDLV